MTEAAIIDRLALPATLAAPEALLAVVLAAALGLLAGALATWALAARPAATARSAAETRAWGAERALAAAEVRGERAVQLAEDGARLRDALADAWAENATLTGTLEAERREHAARLEALTRAEASLADRFAHLASDALGANAERFLALVSERNAAHGAAADADLARRRDEVAALVTPLATTLARLETRVGEIETAREGAYRAIETQVGEIRRVNEDLRGETRRLVQALRAPKTRGRWGELHLRRVFELAGLVDHVDFATEVTLDTADGRLRPDAIVRLPGDRAIVVDAKTPLDAWLDAVEATDPAAEAEAMARHAAQVRAHLRQLSARAYWQHLPEAADFVVMFLPGEAFHAAAVEADPALMEEAFRARVLVATPTTLVGLLRAIAQGWQQTHLAANAREVAEAARDLHERLGTLGGHLSSLGQALRQSVERYNRTLASLERRVLPAARRFEDLGATFDAEALQMPPVVMLEPGAVATPGATTTADAPPSDHCPTARNGAADPASHGQEAKDGAGQGSRSDGEAARP